jgi:hypothetical protein
MNLIPFERLTIHSPLRPDEALKKLEENIQPKLPFIWKRKGQKPYLGKIEGFHFSLRRIIFYRNSFLPMIEGEIQPEMGGSSIRITMHPHIWVLAFMGLWLGGISIFFLAVLFNLLSFGTNASPHQPHEMLIILPIVMIVFGYVLCLGGFKLESVKSKTFFRDLFQAARVDETTLFDLLQAP